MKEFDNKDTPLFEVEQTDEERLSRELTLGQFAMELGY